LSPLAGIAASLAGALPARGGGISFTERVISTAAEIPNSVFATDVDGDGDIDVLSASLIDDKIAWYESDGGSPPTFSERVISTTANGARSVFATDVDGDGDTDVLSASSYDDKIAWYESNGGLPPAFTERAISSTADYAMSVFATDVDGDGNTDVLSASSVDDKIAWYESDGGSPPTFTERVISTSADQAWSVFATDMDGDGDTDVLSASLRDDKIAWYESDGGSPPIFTEWVISTKAQGAKSVFAADVDGDGNTDVLSASSYDDKIAWYESDGGLPPTFTQRVISSTAIHALSVFATDLDGDGDTDVLSAASSSPWDEDEIAWYESDGGSPPTFTTRVIRTTSVAGHSVFATDLDGDGDTDVLTAMSLDTIAWHESATCGDGVVEGPEQCDDGDGDNSDSCPDGDLGPCVPAYCGDGFVWNTDGGMEQCDDGYNGACGSCNADCTGPGTGSICGDGELCLETEQCDDGYNDTCGSCNTDCTGSGSGLGTCGDGVLCPENDEQCDDGDNDICGSCNADCTGAGAGSTCGDGELCPEAEECDDGYSDACGTCNADCTGAGSGSTCGDGEWCPEFEPCDDAGESPTCDPDCTVVECGDGTFNATAGEACDDAYTDACGTCNADCTGPGSGSTCGDGERCPEFEACDDAGESPTCDADCTVVRCGDGTLNVTAGEACDDGYRDACGSCNVDCTGAGAGSTCGDGDLCPETEECDDGNTDDDDGCSSTCAIPIPTVSEWGMVVMGLLVLVAGTVVVMRRRTACVQPRLEA
jgi:cysteine-rich repeat protein